MNKEEILGFTDFGCIKANPFEVTLKAISSECRTMDKEDIYKWVYEDEKKIQELQKQAELGETYKKLYGEIKKQKDDVVKYIKKDWYSKNTIDINKVVIGDWRIDLLRMLGEIDE